MSESSPAIATRQPLTGAIPGGAARVTPKTAARIRPTGALLGCKWFAKGQSHAGFFPFSTPFLSRFLRASCDRPPRSARMKRGDRQRKAPERKRGYRFAVDGLRAAMDGVGARQVPARGGAAPLDLRARMTWNPRPIQPLSATPNFSNRQRAVRNSQSLNARIHCRLTGGSKCTLRLLQPHQ